VSDKLTLSSIRRGTSGDEPGDEPAIDDLPAGQPRPSRWDRWNPVRLLATSTSLLIATVLVILIVVFSIINTGFFSGDNARNITTDAAVLLVLATGSTFVIITAGIDLSVGTVLVLSGVVAAKVMNATGMNNWGVVILGLIVAVATGALVGLINGLIVAKAKLPPFIATLGTLGISLGAAYVITGGVDVTTVPTTLVDSIGVGRVAQIPYLVIIAFATALVFGLMLAFTQFGRHTYAVGSNPESARRAGIKVDRHLIKVYTLAGGLSGFAGILALAFFSTTAIGGHTLDNLSAITGVAIGGTSLFGGVGTMIGTVIGIFIPATLQNGLVVIGVQPFWQQIAVGVVLIIVVMLDQLKRSKYRS
jgi:ribose transport system permease protein